MMNRFSKNVFQGASIGPGDYGVWNRKKLYTLRDRLSLVKSKRDF